MRALIIKMVLLVTLLLSRAQGFLSRQGRRRLSLRAGSSGFRGYEEEALAKGYTLIIGVDEAGRGPLAGPVVAAAVACLSPSTTSSFVIGTAGDSKKLTDSQRREVYKQIIDHPESFAYSFSVVSHKQIDDLNILQATLLAMRNSIEQLVAKLPPEMAQNTHAIIDGNKTPPGMAISARPLVKGDSLCYSIALASCIAKVVRDDIMIEQDAIHPEYNFAKHKGYPTKEHIKAIGLHGPSPIHRLSFKPLKGQQLRADKK